MTGTQDKLRSLFLTALMVLSVFAGTVAFAGTAAAANEDVTFADQVIDNPNPSDGTTSLTVDISQDGTSTIDTVAVWTLTEDNELNEIIGTASASPGSSVELDVSGFVSDIPSDRIGVTIHNTTGDGSASEGNAYAKDTAVVVNPDTDLTPANLPGDTQTVWKGQVIWLDAQDPEDTDYGNSGTQPELYDNSTNTFVTTLSNDANGAEHIDTATLDAGVYYTSSDGGATKVQKFQVIPQQFSASFAKDRVSVTGDQVEANLNIGSNRANYAMLVSADNLDMDEMQEVLNSDKWNNTHGDKDPATADGNMMKYDVVGFEGLLVDGVTKSENILANFSGQDANSYNFTFSVTDTVASDTASIEASEIEGDITFDQSTYQTHRGDTVEITVDMEETSDGWLWIGGQEVNYLKLIQVQDADNDGDVTFEFNTMYADKIQSDQVNNGNLTTADELNNDEWIFQSEDDDVTDRTEEIEYGEWSALGINESLDNVIESGTYEVQAALSSEYSISGGELRVSSTDVAALRVNAPTTGAATAFIAPSNRADTYDGPGELQQAVTESSDVAMGDQMIVRFNLTGVFGSVQDSDDLASAGVEMQFNQTNPGINRDPIYISVTQSNSNAGQAYVDEANGSIWAVVNTNAASGAKGPGDQNQPQLESGQMYNAYIDVTARSFAEEAGDATVDRESNVSGLELQTRSATIQIPGNLDTLEYTANSNQTVNATTNVAPGSEVTARARGFGDSAFLEPSDAVVQPYDGAANGWITADTLDLSGVAEGTDFEVSIRQGGSQIGGPVPATIVAEQQGQLQFDDQVAREDGTLVTIQSVEMNKDGFVVIHNADGGVVGVSRYLPNGTYSNVDVRLNETSAIPAGETMTLTAMLHEDTNDDKVFNWLANPELDKPLEVNGSAVTATADVEHSTPTPTTTTATPTTTTATPTTTTATPTTTTATTTAPPTTTTTEEGGPGFGVIVALVALIAAALLAVRRER